MNSIGRPEGEKGKGGEPEGGSPESSSPLGEQQTDKHGEIKPPEEQTAPGKIRGEINEDYYRFKLTEPIKKWHNQLKKHKDYKLYTEVKELLGEQIEFEKCMIDFFTKIQPHESTQQRLVENFDISSFMDAVKVLHATLFRLPSRDLINWVTTFLENANFKYDETRSQIQEALRKYHEDDDNFIREAYRILDVRLVPTLAAVDKNDPEGPSKITFTVDSDKVDNLSFIKLTKII